MTIEDRIEQTTEELRHILQAAISRHIEILNELRENRAEGAYTEGVITPEQVENRLYKLEVLHDEIEVEQDLTKILAYVLEYRMIKRNK